MSVPLLVVGLALLIWALWSRVAATCMVVLGSVILHGIAGPLLVRRLWPARVRTP